MWVGNLTSRQKKKMKQEETAKLKAAMTDSGIKKGNWEEET